jgi:hypothetical protein
MRRRQLDIQANWFPVAENHRAGRWIRCRIGRIHSRLDGERLVALTTGPRYQLRPTNFWRTEWTFESEDGRVLATLSGRPHLFKQGGVATVTQSAAGLPETPALLLLMWYVRVLIHEEEAAGAVVVACG